MRLFSRLSLALLAVLFAWRLGPALISGLAFIFPAFGGFVKELFPSVQGRTGTEWFEFVIAIFLFWLLFKAAGLALGFMVPQAQLFGTTKALRRFQGLCGEGLIIFSLFIGATFIDAMIFKAPPQKPQEFTPANPSGPADKAPGNKTPPPKTAPENNPFIKKRV